MRLVCASNLSSDLSKRLLVVIRRLRASDYLTAVDHDDRNGMNTAAGEIDLTLTHFVGIQI
ncbi:hypothetical protein D3C87_1802900 [compost metagenome]